MDRSRDSQSGGAASIAPPRPARAGRAPILLIGSFYRDPAPARHEELTACLRLNAANKQIDEFHILIEDTTEPEALSDLIAPRWRSKLRFVRHGRRATYRDLFARANSQGHGRVAVIGNADIWFDSSLRRLRKFDLDGKLLCLSRWDMQANGRSIFYDSVDSQDAWIFRTPIREFFCDFFLGVPACDNRLAWEAEHAGLAISNPSLSVRANHLHLSGIRNYRREQRIAGPSRHLTAGYIDRGPGRLWDLMSGRLVSSFARAIAWPRDGAH
ncbi:MAG TPA: hypothetical protein VGP48_07645 [Stellaceae bacterium]|nr:hypothetical protein [Stellaceae bacterium]